MIKKDTFYGIWWYYLMLNKRMELNTVKYHVLQFNAVYSTTNVTLFSIIGVKFVAHPLTSWDFLGIRVPKKHFTSFCVLTYWKFCSSHWCLRRSSKIRICSNCVEIFFVEMCTAGSHIWLQLTLQMLRTQTGPLGTYDFFVWKNHIQSESERSKLEEVFQSAGCSKKSFLQGPLLCIVEQYFSTEIF